ncbi:MAG: hypothetical protein HRU20_24670 [Pseudomonadales bacterium]|nr:hypothetical protein [Pseudomonadales bacterium]
MSLDEQEKLNNYINSDFGQDILSDYIDSIIKTSSKRARMAIALLFCQDIEFNFNETETETETETRTFISAMNGMTNDLLDFFLEVSTLETKSEGYPYPRAGIHNKIYEIFSTKGWDEEAVFVNITELIQLKILLPDPQAHTGSLSDGSGWAIWFGITRTTNKIASLLRKSSELAK